MEHKLYRILGNAGMYDAVQGRIKTKLGLMLQPRKAPIFLSIGV